MRSALLCASSAEKLFLIRNSGKSADFPELPFHGRGRNGKRKLVSSPSPSLLRKSTSPKGRGKSTTGSFLITPNTLATSLTAWLSLRGKTSPAPGEDVTAGDKRGNLARERLRGRSFLSVFSFHHLCVCWGEKFSPFCTNALKNCRIRMEKTSLSRFTTLPR